MEQPSQSRLPDVNENQIMMVPDDFPRLKSTGAIGGAQPKLLLTEYQGKYYAPGNSPPELYNQWIYCEDIVEKMCTLSLNSKAGKRSHMGEADILSQYLDRMLQAKWASEQELHWVIRRVASILQWPVPEKALVSEDDEAGRGE
jgi:hypothetical protein